MSKKTAPMERVRKLLLLFFAFALFPVGLYADIKVSGTVVDENEEPLVGVSVLEDGTTTGTATDIDGHFYLNVKNGNSKLKFSYVGYETKEMKVGKNISFNIQLTPKLGELDEVVVVGYGKQVKASVVGSIQTIEPARLRVGSTRAVSDNLAGQLAGVIAYKPSGEPGWDASQFWIRGISSFAGGTSPLVLIDGVERTLNDLDPAEIESFSILKDAAASAVYGVRGANGVILVNTKRGQIGAPQVTFRVEQAFRAPSSVPDFIGAAEYMTLMNELANPEGLEGKNPFDADRINKTAIGYDPDLYPDVDWIDAVMKDNSDSSRANLNVSGGSDFLRYALTASWYRESGIMNRDERLAYDTSTKLNKYNVRANVDMNVTKTTLMRFGIGGYLQRVRKQDYSTESIFNEAFVMPPFAHPAIYSDGVIPIEPQRANPWSNATQRGYTTWNWAKVEALVGLEQDLKMILPGLKARALFSFDNYSQNRMSRNRQPTYYSPAKVRDEEGNLVHGDPQNSDGTDYLGHWTGHDDYGNNRTYLEAAVNYDQLFAEKHRVGAMFLYNQTSYDDGAVQPYRHQGIAGRTSYTYDSRYVAEFNFGYNGSENFAPKQRYGFFPSAALGWIVSNEKWWEPISLQISKLKLRASAGEVGSDAIKGRRFAYITTVNSGGGSYRFGTTNNYYAGGGITEGQIGVTNLTWETVTKYNLGLEAGFWNMIDVQFDVFKEFRRNIFIQRSVIPTQTGFSSFPWANYGKVENHGFEGTLEMHKSFTPDFTVGLRSNITYARNKITECDEPESVKGTHRSRTGQSIGTLWGYMADGLYTAEDFNEDGTLVEGLPTPELMAKSVRPGDIKYVDRNGDGLINAKDEGYVGGVALPRIIYGFGANLIYKNTDFSFFFQGSADTYRMLYVGEQLIPGSGQGTMGNIYSNYNDRWTEENPSQDVFWPRLTYGKNAHNQQNSTFFKRDMSFLRLKTVELGYSLPQKWSKIYGSTLTRFYVSGNDLFRFSKFNLWDPELDTSTGMKYPLMRSIMFGVDLKF